MQDSKKALEEMKPINAQLAPLRKAIVDGDFEEFQNQLLLNGATRMSAQMIDTLRYGFEDAKADQWEADRFGYGSPVPPRDSFAELCLENDRLEMLQAALDACPEDLPPNSLFGVLCCRWDGFKMEAPDLISAAMFSHCPRAVEFMAIGVKHGGSVLSEEHAKKSPALKALLNEAHMRARIAEKAPLASGLKAAPRRARAL